MPSFQKTGAVSTSFSIILETLSEAVHQNRFSKRHGAKAERGGQRSTSPEDPDSLDVRSRSARDVEKREDKRARRV